MAKEDIGHDRYGCFTDPHVQATVVTWANHVSVNLDSDLTWYDPTHVDLDEYAVRRLADQLNTWLIKKEIERDAPNV